MDRLSFFYSPSQRIKFFGLLLILFTLNIFFLYKEYQDFSKNEVFTSKGEIANIYPNDNFNTLKIVSDDIIFFTSASKDFNISKFQEIQYYIITKNIDFLDYLKGFYAKSFGIKPIDHNISLKNSISESIETQHKHPLTTSLYQALFLAINLDPRLREFCANLGISHLIAISGFHLGVIFGVFYFLLNYLYRDIHKRYFPYRNQKFDIIILSGIIIFFYMVLIDIPASLLRSFLMFVLGFYFLRNHIKILSFETLLIVLLIIIAFFPKLLFSLSLWFSIAGVFYIFLFLQYFKNQSKIVQVLLFNFWIFFAINPIVHFFFDTTSIYQLLSPILTLLFTIFYPLSALAHLLNIGDIFDPYLILFFNIQINAISVSTPFWFTSFYILISLYSIISKNSFYVLNMLFIIFNIYLFYSALNINITY